MNLTRRRWLFVALLSGVLAGCGFHLQGVVRLPPAFAATGIAADDRYTDFHRALRAALQTSGSRVVDGAVPDGATVDILEDTSVQRVLSVSAANIPTEYEVFYTLRYRVRVGGREVLKPQVLKLSKEYSFNETAVLAKDQERATIRRALADELAAIVMRRLAALTP